MHDKREEKTFPSGVPNAHYVVGLQLTMRFTEWTG